MMTSRGKILLARGEDLGRALVPLGVGDLATVEAHHPPSLAFFPRGHSSWARAGAYRHVIVQCGGMRLLTCVLSLDFEDTLAPLLGWSGFSADKTPTRAHAVATAVFGFALTLIHPARGLLPLDNRGCQ